MKEFKAPGTCVGHAPCQVCGSSDAVGVYDNGTAYCFSCKKNYPQWDGDVPQAQESAKKKKKYKGLLENGECKPLLKRKLTEETCRKFHYQCATLSDGTNVQLAPYYKDGHLVAQHIRTATKDFKWLGDAKKLELFGQHLWRQGGRRIVITEGEIDCMTISQLQDNKWPVVSVPSGAQSAAKYIRQNIEFLESYEKIILAFDNDEPGKKATEDCAQLFSPGKAHIMHLPDGCKDANDMLQAGLTEELIAATWDAKPWRPDGIVNAQELLEEVQKPIKWGLSYPWENLTQQTYGIRLNELVAIGAGTGLGKTEFLKEVVTHLLIEHQEKVGLIFLEESNTDTVKGIMSKQASKLFHIPDAEYTQEEFDAAFKATAGTGRLFLYDHFGHTDYDTIKARIRYMVVNCGVRFIFLDHITALVSGDKDADERRQLDYIMTDLASLVRELNINIHFISHLATPDGVPHEEGGRVKIRHFRGSRSIGQWSSFMYGLERDQQNKKEMLRHVTTVRVLKDRYTGRAAGYTMNLKYDRKTGRLEHWEEPPDGFDTDEEAETEFENAF